MHEQDMHLNHLAPPLLSNNLHPLGGNPSLSPNASPHGLPASVRGAPPELRRAIRKRQNSESAKRCRERKKLESARASQELVAHAGSLARLEGAVAVLARRIDATAAVVAQLTGVPPNNSPPPPSIHTTTAAPHLSSAPLPPPLKRSLHMLHHGMSVGPDQLRAIADATAPSAPSAPAPPLPTPAKIESPTTTSTSNSAAAHFSVNDIHAMAAKVDDLGAAWN